LRRKLRVIFSMPELPEVETVRRSVENAVVGARITQVEVGRERTVRRSSKQALIAGLHQETIVAVRRHGKDLLFDLSSGNVMMVHLRMSGRLLLAAPGDSREKHTHVVLTLEKKNEDVRELRFVDPRTFGEVVVYNPDDDNPEAGTESLVPEVARLGLDPLTGNFTFDAFRERFDAASVCYHQDHE
jgi:formamidopyrimidine-DNA glycosylase